VFWSSIGARSGKRIESMTSTFCYISFKLTFKVCKAKELAEDRCPQYGLGIKDGNIMSCVLFLLSLTSILNILALF